MSEVLLDLAREERVGVAEAMLCQGKSAEQIVAILDMIAAGDTGMLLTRLDHEKHDSLPERHQAAMDYCSKSRTAFFGELRPVWSRGDVAIVSAGTSDVPVAREAERTLRHAGVEATFIADVGVAGLWRLTERLEDIRAHPVVIAAAGMDAALASVLGGLVSSALIAVPTSVGYGVTEGGRTALNAMLASCAPGVLVCNIDNGYGAACAALRILIGVARMGH
jgi:pyridinium-3,5-biscarboxylic acid mononucleotide synthase